MRGKNNMIRVGESFDLFLETLKHSNSEVLNLSDELIEYYLLEEFAIEAPAYLSEFTLNRLLNEGIIDANILEKGKTLQKMYLSMDQMKNWDASFIKESSEWGEIITLSTKIFELVRQKWTEEEIKYLKTL